MLDFEGITVLNTYITNPIDRGAWLIFLAGLFVLIVIGIFGIYTMVLKEKFGIIFLSIAIIGAIVISSLFQYDIKHPNTVYEITISDNVNMNEFFDNFEIVNKRGEIYVVKTLDKIENP